MREVRSDIVIVGIDAASLAALDQWPWPRRHHAKLVGQLTHAAPASVFLDIDFSSQSNPLDDAVLEAALAQAARLPGGSADLLPERERHRRQRFRSASRCAASRAAPRAQSSTASPGPMACTRHWRNFWTIEGDACASVIDPRRVLPDDQDVPIDFSISPASFTYVSYVDVLEGRVPRAVLADKTVFVGATAVELGDMLPVPVYRSLPGIVVQALAAETVNQGAPRALPDVGCRSRCSRCGRPWRRCCYGAQLGAQSGACWRLRWRQSSALSLCALCLLAAAARHRGAHARGHAAVRRGHRALARGADLARAVLRARHAPARCAAQERGAVVHRLHRLRRRGRHHQDRESGRVAPVRLRRSTSCVDEPIAKFITLLAGEAPAHGSARCTA